MKSVKQKANAYSGKRDTFGKRAIAPVYICDGTRDSMLAVSLA